MLAPDFSEHFGRLGEFIIGLVGLLLLALMHRGVRGFASNGLAEIGRRLIALNAWLTHKNAFYGDWARAFHMIFRERRDLILIVMALTAFDYLTGWHADFMIERFDLSPKYESYDFISIYIAFYLSAPFALTLLQTAGYTLFCWLAYRTTSGASYSEASRFKPLLQVAGLFLCLHGAEALADIITPYLFYTLSQLAEDAQSLAFLAAGVLVGAIACILGVLLVTKKPKGANLATASSAMLGYLLATHLLHWLYFFLDRASMATTLTWVRVAEHHASNFTYTLLWNIALVAFVVRLSGPPREQAEISHHAANAV
ncbi:MAG: hypothetical protein CMI63_03090 [Parvularcula sp.]|nr:hypothetical protein [Parvularcula sp.]